jgi:hypothetical protein
MNPKKKAMTMTPAELEEYKAGVVQKLRNFDTDSGDDAADRIDEMSAAEYAEEKGIALLNPVVRRSSIRFCQRGEKGVVKMARMSKDERIEELEQENADLQDRLDQIEQLSKSDDEEDDAGDDSDEEE